MQNLAMNRSFVFRQLSRPQGKIIDVKCEKIAKKRPLFMVSG